MRNTSSISPKKSSMSAAYGLRIFLAYFLVLQHFADFLKFLLLYSDSLIFGVLQSFLKSFRALNDEHCILSQVFLFGNI
jgi:hypothetical protein